MSSTRAMDSPGRPILPPQAEAEILDRLFTDTRISSGEIAAILKKHGVRGDESTLQDGYQDLYALRKQTIERVFADAKEKHAMRYTQYRGLAQVSKWVRLKFAAMNLKKLALWKWRKPTPDYALLLFFCSFFLMHENRAYAAA